MTWFPNKTCWRWRSWILISKGGMLNVCLLPGLCNISTNLTVWKLRSYELCRLLGVRPHIMEASKLRVVPVIRSETAHHQCELWMGYVPKNQYDISFELGSISQTLMQVLISSIQLNLSCSGDMSKTGRFRTSIKSICGRLYPLCAPVLLISVVSC